MLTLQQQSIAIISLMSTRAGACRSSGSRLPESTSPHVAPLDHLFLPNLGVGITDCFPPRSAENTIARLLSCQHDSFSPWLSIPNT